jgi:hypothetical protein
MLDKPRESLVDLLIGNYDELAGLLNLLADDADKLTRR